MTTIEGLLEAVFSVGSAPKLYNEDKSQAAVIVLLGKVKPGTGSIRGLNLAVIKHMTVQVTRLS
jgi:hypothetical protein